ncbi:MAG: imidazole glycerol phosphate synthase subunit HisF [Planctomycetes bacterium]|nr:imidazole glycerol phosphate synthase subunit HisF [Planctomycetota bacterium]
MEMVNVVPCLDIKDGRVVKGVKFVNLRDARDPAEAAAAYCKQGADEIVFLDIAATVEKRKTRLEWVKKVAKVVTVPFTVGGGIGSLDEMKALFDLGVTKVSINTAAVRNPDLIEEAGDAFGPDRIVVAIDAQKGEHGFEVLISGGTKKAGLELVEWAQQVEDMGAGEILLTSKDADGTLDGYDVPMTLAVADAVTIPVTASGGCGKLEHMAKVIIEGHATAVLAASVFHFGTFTVHQAKQYLKSQGIPVHL